MEEKELTMADFEDQLDYDSFTAPKWANFAHMMEDHVNIDATIDGVVKGGFIVVIDEVRGFLPLGHASLKRIENPESMLGQEITVRIIEVDRTANRLVLSARDILREQRDADKARKAQEIAVGSLFKGKVDAIKDFGVFVRNEDGVSGLLHISQISHERVKHPKDVFKVGDDVEAKVIKNDNGKLSLSVKALSPVVNEDAQEENVVIPEAENIATSLGDLLKGIELPD